MLQIQEYLRNGKTLEDLKNELAISATPHTTLPLVTLNYCQLDSPKTHPLVMECRSLILEKDTWNIASRAFHRFFNLGEAPKITGKFDWSNYRAYFKEDGSLCHLYHWENEWRMGTRSTDGSLLMTEQTFTWRELFWDTLRKTQQELNCILNKDYTYILEMCSLFNQNTTIYPEPKLVLLDEIHKKCGNVFIKPSCIDDHNWLVDRMAKYLGVERPKVFDVKGKTFEEIRVFVDSFPNQEEGIVLQDWTGLRIKAKNKNWLAINKLSKGGQFFYKDLYDLVISGENQEVETYYPAIKTKCETLFSLIHGTKERITTLWGKIRHIENQKEFALALLGENPPLGWVLFECRRHNLTIGDVFNSPKYYEKIKKGILELI